MPILYIHMPIMQIMKTMWLWNMPGTGHYTHEGAHEEFGHR